MVRKFLFFMFDSFVLVVLFISLFQYAGSSLNLGSHIVFSNDNYFGFYSLIKFLQSFSEDSNIINYWNNFISFIDNIISNYIDTWEEAINVDLNRDFNIFNDFISNLKVIGSVLAFPVWLLIAFGGFIIYLFIVIYSFISKFAQLLMGYYNIPFTSYNTPVLAYKVIPSFVGVYSF